MHNRFFNSLQSSRLRSQPVLLFALASHFLVSPLRTVNAIPEQRELVRKMSFGLELVAKGLRSSGGTGGGFR